MLALLSTDDSTWDDGQVTVQVSQKSERGNEETLDEKDKHQTLLDFTRCLISNMEEKQPGYD